MSAGRKVRARCLFGWPQLGGFKKNWLSSSSSSFSLARFLASSTKLFVIEQQQQQQVAEASAVRLLACERPPLARPLGELITILCSAIYSARRHSSESAETNKSHTRKVVGRASQTKRTTFSLSSSSRANSVAHVARFRLWSACKINITQGESASRRLCLRKMSAERSRELARRYKKAPMATFHAWHNLKRGYLLASPCQLLCAPQLSSYASGRFHGTGQPAGRQVGFVLRGGHASWPAHSAPLASSLARPPACQAPLLVGH